MPQQMEIDPRRFAELIIQSQPSHGNDPEKIVKEKLTLYLVAEMLAEKFNELEAQMLHGDPSSFDNLLMKIDKLKIFNLDRNIGE
ncbi:hypothetical protein [Sporolactobacillus sp. KGMB 08714]|uniref:hypothetical protein n=1 Tax=Sporolactobacillus sp. KGMB 08714 TaxID=3064704 RepID=UPI002FBE1282